MLKKLLSAPRSFWNSISPGRPPLRTAGRLLLTLSATIIGSIGVSVIFQDSVSFEVTLAFLQLLGYLILLAVGIFLLIKILATAPTALAFGVVFSLTFLWFQFGARSGFEGYLTVIAGFVLPTLFLGIGLRLVKERHARHTHENRRWVFGTALAFVGGIGLLGSAFWFFNDGAKRKAPVNAALKSQVEITHISADDPSKSGGFAIKYLTYGSGKDKHRPEFAKEADLITQPVDASPFVENWDKRTGWARTRFWGFGPKSMPLQGRVWSPEGDGPFPLVLIVHGNHSMEEFSDPGYAYLGEFLASRGYIFVSLDMNFLNSSYSSRLDGFRGRNWTQELDARGWMFLEHLRVWHEWNATPDSPFFNKVDTSKIGLIGHSRGGEAVAIAAMFNKMARYPDNANVRFNYNFNIQGVIAIAPVDRYEPAGLWTTVEDVDYFVLHGSHDADVQSFRGSRQFERVSFSGNDYHFKSSLYIYGANHGQFNTVWGRSDASYPWKNFLNLRDIMPAEEQRQIAKVYISAFLEASLSKSAAYLPLFQDARAGKNWLPETVYLTQFDDANSRYFQTFEEDLDVTTTTIPGGQISGRNLKTWREKRVSLKQRDKATNAVYLGWETESGKTPEYSITLPHPLPVTSSDDLLTFALAADKNKESSNDKKNSTESRDELIDFTIELTDQAGNAADVALSDFSLLQPQISVQVSKSEMFNSTPTSEPVYQTFAFQISRFSAKNSQLDFTQITKVVFRFNKTKKGKLIIDHLGLRTGPKNNEIQ